MSTRFDWMQAWPVSDTRVDPHASRRVSGRAFWAVTISLSAVVSYVIVSEQYALGAALGIAFAFALLCFVKPQLALLVFLIYMPVEGMLGKLGINLSVMRGVNPETFVTLLYAAIGLPRILSGARPPSSVGGQILPMVLLSGLMLLSIAWNPHVGTDTMSLDLAEIKRAAFFFLTFLLVLLTPDKRRYLNVYLGVFLLVCIYLALDLAWLRTEKMTLTRLGSRVMRFSESAVHTSPLVLGLGASVLVALTIEKNISFFPRILCLSSAGLLVLSSFLLLSRAVSAAVIVGVVVTLLVSRAWKRNLVPLLLILPSLWFLLPEDLTARFARSLLNVQSGGSSFTTKRLEVAWPDAIETISEHPILGVGFGAYGQMAKLAPHNQLLNIWVQLGIGGVILFLWIYTSLVKVAWRARGNDDPKTRVVANGLFGQLLGCAFALQFSDSFFSPWLTYALFFTAVLLEPVADGTLGHRAESRLEESSSIST